MKTLTVILLCALMLASCAQAPPDASKARAEIEAMMKKAATDMMNGVIDTALTQYTDDATSMPSNGPLLRGKAEMREFNRKMMAMNLKIPKAEFRTVDVQVGGPYAYEVGTYTMTVQATGMPETTEDGKYLNVYQKAQDGSWKIKAEIWNSNAPMPMPQQDKQPMPEGAH